MGTIKLDHYVLILRGDNLLEFIDGISTNKVDGSCTTVFTDKNAKIIDMVEVIEKEDFVAIVGHNLYKDSVISHISSRVLDANIQIFDITNSNNVFFTTNKSLTVENATIHKSIIGKIMITPKDSEILEDMTYDEFSEYRVKNLIPYQGHEIVQNLHPLACGLGELVHEAKGCYVGQEILARMRSRGKQGKELVRLENPVEDATTVGETHSLRIQRIQN